MPLRILLSLLALLPAACADRFTPDTYATRAVQQANKVEQGVVVGRRDVRITAEGSTGAATGGAAGAVLGAQAPGGGIVSALGGVGGALVGGLVGRATEGAAVDAPAYEYVVRTAANELVSVTQRDKEPLSLGTKVLVITGNQARVVPDYIAPGDAPAAPPEPSSAAAIIEQVPRSATPVPPLPAYPTVPPAPPLPDGAGISLTGP